MLFKDHFGMVLSTIVMLILGFCMSIVGIIVSHAPVSALAIFSGWASSYLINTIAAIILPVPDWGFAFAVKLCKAKQGTVKFILLNGLIMAVVYVTIISLGMTLINVGPSPVIL